MVQVNNGKIIRIKILNILTLFKQHLNVIQTMNNDTITRCFIFYRSNILTVKLCSKVQDKHKFSKQHPVIRDLPRHALTGDKLDFYIVKNNLNQENIIPDL